MQETMASSNDWQTCPSGVLVNTVRRTQRQAKRKRARPYVLAGTLAVLVVTAVVVQYNRPAPNDYLLAGIRCSKVIRLLDKLAENKLDAATKEQVEAHLMLCSKCRDIQMKMGPKVALNRDVDPAAQLRLTMVAWRGVPLCTCGQCAAGRH